MFFKKLFGNNISPDCEYCRYYAKNSSGDPMCSKGSANFVTPCFRYAYDPLKREPKVMPEIPEFTADDFKL